MNLEPYELIFTPVLDGDFFPRPLDELRRELSPRRVMVGTVDDEGLLFALVQLRRPTVKSIRAAIRFYIRKSEYDNYEVSTSIPLPSCEALWKHVEDVYIGHVDPRDKAAVTRQFLRLLGDIGLTNGTFEMADKMAAFGHSVFLYNFDYFNPNAFGLFKPVMPYKGPSPVLAAVHSRHSWHGTALCPRQRSHHQVRSQPERPSDAARHDFLLHKLR